MLKEKAQGQQPEAESTNASIRLRLLHSSDEVGVMPMERREQAIASCVRPTGNGMSPTMQRKGDAFLRRHEPCATRVSSTVLWGVGVVVT